jgi:hypothetical protein
MRDLFSKLMTGSMIAGAALLVSACGGSETANTAETNLTEMNSMDTMESGSMNDVTAVDGAMADTNMSMDANSAAPMDSMGGNTSTEGNMTSNAM